MPFPATGGKWKISSGGGEQTCRFCHGP